MIARAWLSGSLLSVAAVLWMGWRLLEHAPPAANAVLAGNRTLSYNARMPREGSGGRIAGLDLYTGTRKPIINPR